jgi:predicted glycoside hydrolase/deacetylase ChbG (UPF0249 family)
MTSNPTLEQLGFGPHERVAIVHADDIGMCHAANVAFWQDQSFGIVTCGSVMMPCPWVPEMAAWCREHPEADVGVHLTLNSEWAGYRWRPLSTCDPKSGLVDGKGYMWRSVEDVYRHMDVDAAITSSAAYRIADYETFLRPELKAYLSERGIHLIRYRRLRDLILRRKTS